SLLYLLVSSCSSLYVPFHFLSCIFRLFPSFTFFPYTTLFRSEVHGDRVRGVLGAREPRLDHREPRLHEHHEKPGHQRPHEVDRDGIRRGGGARSLGERVRRRHTLPSHYQRACQSHQQAKTDRASHTTSE